LAYTMTIPFTVEALFTKHGFIPDIEYLLADSQLVVQLADAVDVPTDLLLSGNLTDYATLADGEALPESITYVSETMEFKISSSDVS